MHEQQLVVRNLPCAMQGLRIGVQADIHPSPVNDARYGKTIVERTMAVAPDLIVPPSIEVLTLTAEKYKRRLWFSCKKSDSIFSLYFYNVKHLQLFETFCINQTVLRLKIFVIFLSKNSRNSILFYRSSTYRSPYFRALKIIHRKSLNHQVNSLT